MKKEEGVYYIKRVSKLPKSGNANVLYAIRDSVLEELFRWQPGGGYETITVGAPPGVLDNVYTANGSLEGTRVIDLDGNEFTIQTASGNEMIYLNPTANEEEANLAAINDTDGGNEASINNATTATDASSTVQANFNNGAKIASFELFANVDESTATLDADIIELNGEDISLNINGVGGVQGANGGVLQVIGQNGIQFQFDGVSPVVGQVIKAKDTSGGVEWSDVPEPRAVDTATLGATFNVTINATDHRNKWLVTSQQDGTSGVLQLNTAGLAGFTVGDEIILINNGVGEVRVAAIGVTVITPVQPGATYTFQEGERVSIVVIDSSTVSYHVTTT